VSVHDYDPQSFTSNATTKEWGKFAEPGKVPASDKWGQEDNLIKTFDALKSTYIDKGIPVIIDEMGCVNQTGYENYRAYYCEYFIKAAHDRGIVSFFWDNGGMGTGADKYALIDRYLDKVLDRSGDDSTAVVARMMKAVNTDYDISTITLEK
jgi:endoglucanase